MSLRNAIQRTANIAGRRFVSSAALPKAPVPEIYQSYSFKKAFLMDTATYPIFLVMTVATSLVVGALLNGLTYKNIKLNKATKHQIMPDDTPHRVPVLEIITREPKCFYAQGMKAARQEGFGINHEEWKKAKQAYDGISRE